MHSWSEHRFVLDDTDHPSVCPHPTSRRPCVTFYCRSYEPNGQGFNVELSRAHLGDVQHLLAALQALPPLPGELDDDPFANAPRCPTCPETTPRAGFPCNDCADTFAFEANR